VGLDISLYTKAEREQSDRHHAEWSALWDRKEAGEITEGQFDEERKTITGYARCADVPSEKHPDHLFNRRYLRSSYNGSGFNRAIPDFLEAEDATLEGIFAPVWEADSTPLVIATVIEESEETALAVPDETPDDDQAEEVDEEDEDRRGEPGGWIDQRHIGALGTAKQRALTIAERLRTCDPLRVEAIHGPILGDRDHLWSQLPTDDEVLAWFRSEQAKREAMKAEREAAGKSLDDGWLTGGYSNAKGTVFGFTEGMDVLAVTVGRDVIGRPAPMIVYRSKAVDSYIESAEIVAEFCDEAIGLIQQDGTAYVSWSG
jgi:hypothetical protein